MPIFVEPPPRVLPPTVVRFDKNGLPTRAQVEFENRLHEWLKRMVLGLGQVHDVRVRTVSATLNNAVANGGVLRFDTVDADTDGYAPLSAPFSAITIPPGLAGVYFLTAASSGSGTQATTLGMGVLVNGTQSYSVTNQSLTGPASINYTLDNGAVEILRLAAGDTVQLINTSVSSGPNVFKSTFMALAHIGV